ncbi:site-specific integrase [Pseudidiomarina gelatinasegens]|uniref:Site-specific integrase n=1 Tax=Pseudidiomarina gelatinasegens TaxID=2487740 RepID=A0A443YXY0_9GAMM|nr:tyrosine-type recombinase/integrase [Pseudidiomarina gelatinasegens]RWU08863.1 site-specific integrase [Pseudidiomarina gelatinasegens]
MAKLIYSTNVSVGSKVDISDVAIRFLGGVPLGRLPTLYDAKGQFVIPVNQWFIHLSSVKKLEDLSSYAKALKRYWTFLDTHDLRWDYFPQLKSFKPTYRFRNEELLKHANDGLLAYSTANNYMSHVIQFYKWAAYEDYFSISAENKPFEVEFVSIKSRGPLAHLRPRFTVETSDLRIRVPRDSISSNVRSLSPLTIESISNLAASLRYSPVEFRLISFLGILCGLRAEEAAGITLNALVRAVPRDDSQLYFNLTIGPQVGVPTKFNKTRTIEISRTLLDQLKKYAISERRYNRLNKLQSQLRLTDDSNIQASDLAKKSKIHNTAHDNKQKSAQVYEPLFISQLGNPITSKGISTRFGELRRKIETSGSNFQHKFHDLRSTYATYRLHSLLTSGLDPATSLDLIMQWMGHNHESTTWKYLQYLKRKEALKDKISMLDNIMHEALMEAGID